jgi:hypothetical protein
MANVLASRTVLAATSVESLLISPLQTESRQREMGKKCQGKSFSRTVADSPLFIRSATSEARRR